MKHYQIRGKILKREWIKDELRRNSEIELCMYKMYKDQVGTYGDKIERNRSTN